MSKKYPVATVFGGTGFVGTQVVRELASRGIMVKVATRVPERAYFLKPCGVVGQVVPFACQYSDPHSISEAVKGSDYVVNCIGILFERGKRSTFSQSHVDIPASIAKACSDHNVSRFVHVSALACDKANSRYAKTKLEGEKAVLSNFPLASILRPSVIFGEDDDFFNMFAELSRYLPFLPLIGGGKTLFQPVFVGDVADSVMACLFDNENAQSSVDVLGKVFELGGPDIVSFKDIYDIMFGHTKRRRLLVPVPWGVAKIQASVLGLLPRPLLTRDQVESLKTDTVVSERALTFDDLGLHPRSMDLILPNYLERFQPGGRFSAVT